MGFPRPLRRREILSRRAGPRSVSQLRRQSLVRRICPRTPSTSAKLQVRAPKPSRPVPQLSSLPPPNPDPHLFHTTRSCLNNFFLTPKDVEPSTSARVLPPTYPARNIHAANTYNNTRPSHPQHN
ncbi:hypothetical protein HYQ46_000368 [Verticillium longisporum]|nr:hypothetical protein HYQ46_000368 [Verticillium longisporum]